MDRIITKKFESGAMERGKEKEPLRLEDYIKTKSKVVVSKDEMTEKKIKLENNIATLSYYNADTVKFDVEGYNLMYVDDGGDLRKVFIKPDGVVDLSRANQLHEREEIEKKLEEIGYKIDDSDNFKNILDKITNKPKSQQEVFSYQDKIKIYQEQSEIIPFYALACLAGQDTKEAWGLREKFLRNLGKENLTEDELDGLRGVAQGLAGINTERAWEIRRQLVSVAPESTARGMAGFDSEEAWNLRNEIKDKYLDRDGVSQGLAESLAGLDSDKAWKLRGELIKIVPESVLEGLAGIDSKKAWGLRDEYKNKEPLLVGASLIGLNNNKARQLRKELLNINIQDEFGSSARGVIVGLVGIDDEEAWDLREKYFQAEPFGVGTSLAGIKNTHKYFFINKIRERIKEREEELDNNTEEIKQDKTLIKMRKGLLQGLHSNYALEAIKMNQKI
jgi:hypothetical protein